MRLSTTYKFIALANPRCGSTSIRKMLNRRSEYKSGVNCDLKDHSALRTVERFVQDKLDLCLDDFFIFTTVRNPWARAVSIYHYGLKNPNSAWHRPAVTSSGFKEFLYSDVLARHFRLKPESVPLSEGTYDIDTFMRDRHGNLRGHVFRLEKLRSFQPVLKAGTGLNIGIPHKNRTRHRFYRDYYDAESRRQVSHLFEPDIERFGYSF